MSGRTALYTPRIGTAATRQCDACTPKPVVHAGESAALRLDRLSVAAAIAADPMRTPCGRRHRHARRAAAAMDGAASEASPTPPHQGRFVAPRQLVSSLLGLLAARCSQLSTVVYAIRFSRSSLLPSKCLCNL